MSTRGVNNLSSDYWKTGREEDKNWTFFMVHFCDMIETVNLVYLKIIMFSFLIAIINTTYRTSDANKQRNHFVQRCGMNQYSYQLCRLLPFIYKNETDLMVVSAFFNDQKDDNVPVQNDAKTEEILQNQREALENQRKSLEYQEKNQEMMMELLKKKN